MQKKILIVCCIVVILQLFVAGVCAYTNNEFKISFDDPQGWTILAEGEDFDSSGSEVAGISYVPSSYLEGKEQAIIIYGGSYTQYDAKYLLDQYVDEIEKQMTGFSLVSESYTKVDGETAYECVYTYTSPYTDSIYYKLIYCSGDGMLYAFTFSGGDKDTFDKYLPVFNNLMNSVQLDFDSSESVQSAGTSESVQETTASSTNLKNNNTPGFGAYITTFALLIGVLIYCGHIRKKE